jgi:phosphoribosyl 1,2-cyclic phosphodiesterase
MTRTEEGLHLWPLASGSNGNAVLLWSGKSAVLIDDGVSTRRLTGHLAAVGLSLANLEAVVLTHEHSDHVGGLPVLRKHCAARIIASPGTAESLKGMKKYDALASGKTHDVGPFAISSFPIPHDAEEPMGIIVDCCGKRVVSATDVGHLAADVLDAFRGADVAVVESNHDPEMLHHGPYPKFLKDRIAGPMGHLSNDEGAELAIHAAAHGAKSLVLAHLSESNNLPQLALASTSVALKRSGRKAHVTVAPRGQPGERIDI